MVSGVHRLSPAARSVWAKSQYEPSDPEHIVGWLPLWRHLDDAAGMARRVWDEWLPPALKRGISHPFEGDEDAARALLVWLASVHDVGKVSPAFSSQVPRLADRMNEFGFGIGPEIRSSEGRPRVRHELVGHLAVADWLTRAPTFPAAHAFQLASIVAAHHGLPPGDAQLLEAQRRWPRLIGDGLWEQVRQEFLARSLEQVPNEVVDRWRATMLPLHVQVELSALVIVADWIASNEKYFPYVGLDEQPPEDGSARMHDAWRTLDLPSPWRPEPPESDLGIFFAARFSLPPGARPRPVQRDLVRVARDMTEPGLMILEAEMGVGKTEAALAAAEILAARFGLGGIYIGLPTQATSDGMFSRVLDWAQRLELDTPNSVYLARSRASLQEEYAALASAAYFRSIGQDHSGGASPREHDDAVIAHHWFSDPKRGPLANLVVGTIDQGLFMGLRSRHVMLRHLALAGKVIIIDEAHAYSDFMNVYAERMLHWLGAYGVPVIVLSATLPSERRRSLVAAYNQGRLAAGTHRVTNEGRALFAARHDVLEGDIGYPVISSSGGGDAPSIVISEGSGANRSLAIDRIDDSEKTLLAELRGALREGGCAVVIRNTVARVQATARTVRAALPDVPVLVAHSRFLGLDRAAKDRKLLQLFGRQNQEGARPFQYVVVASQVVEQSLDLDFDLMVSDLAPIDLLLQRAGRLHRHERDRGQSQRPTPLRTARLLITGVDWSQIPPERLRDYRSVYPLHLLYRTLAVLDGHDQIVLPDDIPSLVQTVYGSEPLGPAEWAEPMAAARASYETDVREKKQTAKDFLLREDGADEDLSLIGWLYAQAGDPDNERRGRASVRDGDESVEVLVLQRASDGVTLQTPSWIGKGAAVPLPLNEPPKPELVRTILGCGLRLPPALSAPWAIDATIRELETEFNRLDLASWYASPALRGELVLVLDEHGHGSIGTHRLHYDNDIGLEVVTDD